MGFPPVFDRGKLYFFFKNPAEIVCVIVSYQVADLLKFFICSSKELFRDFHSCRGQVGDKAASGFLAENPA